MGHYKYHFKDPIFVKIHRDSLSAQITNRSLNFRFGFYVSAPMLVDDFSLKLAGLKTQICDDSMSYISFELEVHGELLMTLDSSGKLHLMVPTLEADPNLPYSTLNIAGCFSKGNLRGSFPPIEKIIKEVANYIRVRMVEKILDMISQFNIQHSLPTEFRPNQVPL